MAVCEKTDRKAIRLRLRESNRVMIYAGGRFFLKSGIMINLAVYVENLKVF